jgi:hypothetical protein
MSAAPAAVGDEHREIWVTAFRKSVLVGGWSSSDWAGCELGRLGMGRMATWSQLVGWGSSSTP